MGVDEDNDDEGEFDKDAIAALVRKMAGLSAAMHSEAQNLLSEAEAAVQENPDDPTAHAYLGGVLLDLHQYPEAQAAYERSLGLNISENRISVMAELAQCLNMQGQHEQAEALLQQAYDATEQDADVRNEFLELQSRTGQELACDGMYEPALPHLRWAIQAEDAGAEDHLALGTCLIETNQFAQAELPLSKARASELVAGIPGMAETLTGYFNEIAQHYYDRGFAAMQEYEGKVGPHKARELLEEAEKSFAKSAELAPTYWHAHLGLAKVCGIQIRRADRMTHLQNALKAAEEGQYEERAADIRQLLQDMEDFKRTEKLDIPELPRLDQFND